MRGGKLTISDSPMFERVMGDAEICKGMIRVILGIEVDSIEYRNVEQRVVPQLGSKGVRLDAFVKADGRVYDIEMQSYRQPFLGARFRYYQSVIDTDSMNEGDDYGDIPESFIVFLCSHDPFGAGLPVYRIERVCLEDPTLDIGCSAHWVALNASAYRAAPEPLANLLQYVARGTVLQGDELVARIDAAVRKANADRKWVSDAMGIMTMERNHAMLLSIERREAEKRGREEGLAKGRAEGQAEGRAEGRAEGESRIKKLVSHLVADGRTDELVRIADDPQLVERLCEEYGISFGE